MQGEKALELIKQAGSSTRVQLLSLDLGDFRSVRKFAKSVHEIVQSKIHILINNAGGKSNHYAGFNCDLQSNFKIGFLIVTFNSVIVTWEIHVMKKW
jgi:hypothetical protein